MRSLQEIFLEARDAATHGDAGPAYRCLREIKKLRATPQFNPGERARELDELERVLRFVALPELPPEDAAQILRSEVIALLQFGIDLDDRLAVRHVFITYGEKDADRRFLQQAILENAEKVGTQTVAEWLKSFDKAYAPETREPRAVQDFFTRDPHIVTLSEKEKIMLKIILNSYENWLSSERLTIFDIAYLKQNPEALTGGSQGPYVSEGANVAYGRMRKASDGAARKTERLPLLKAMSQYRRLNEQLLTSGKIKLKTSTEPARPTLGNWLKVYREELGIGFHETALRGNFLFQSQNCKRLSSDERARLNLILKSLEEEFPLEIDTKAEVIVFPTAADAAGSVQARSQVGRAATPSNPQLLKPLFGQSAAPEKNVSGETLHFSTGHVLPAERAGASSGEGGNVALREMQHPTQGIKRPAAPAPPKSPYSIRPMRLRNEEDQAQ